MKYKLITDSSNNIADIKLTVLKNRGIDNIAAFINANSCINNKPILNYNLLDNIEKAVKCTVKHIKNNSNIHIVVDCDCDGYCSAAMLYQYLKKYAPLNITYSLHTGKQHGLSEDVEIPENTNLIICPDSSSNDYEQHKQYNEQGIDIIVLDHHECNKYSEHAIVVNNQMSEKYTNKDFCGAGIVFKFLEALDDELWNNDACSYLDLVAIANIADMMDSRSLETRYFMNMGLNHITSELIQSFHKKVCDRMGEEFTLLGVAFYIVPLINATIRVGTQEQKDLMFKAFCGECNEFDYIKRDKTVIRESISDRAAREAVNAKSRQDRLKSSVTKKLTDYIDKNRLDENKIIIVNADDFVTHELTGLVAANIAEKYKRPALLYRRKEGLYKGSMRNYSGFELQNLKDFLIGSALFKNVEGHQNAAGFGFKSENEEKIIEFCNQKLANFSNEYIYYVDFIIDFEDLADSIFYDINDLKNLWGQKVNEPYWAIKNIDIELNTVEINKGKTTTTIKFNADGIEFVKFKVPENDVLLRVLEDWDYESNDAKIDVVGRIGINSFGGVKSKQVVVSDWCLVYA